jgi:ribosomal protein S18 acetylase RimI-like enzyme
VAEPCDNFAVTLDIVIRPCREDDLPALEWLGLFAAQRPLIRRIFQQHRRGTALMLVVQANGEPSGQLWAGMQHADGKRVGVIWAVRVMPCLQRLGIGSRLMTAAEAALLDRGFARAQVDIEMENTAARQFYEKLGYRLAGTSVAGHVPGSPPDDGRPQWVFAKQLRQKTRALARSPR